MEPSYLQIRAMASEFDGGNNYREEKKAAVFEPAAMPQPGRRVRDPRARRRTADVRQPSHPRADWAGIVPPETKKKMVSGTAAQQSLGPGLAPVTAEAPKPQRKHFEKDVRFASIDPGAAGAPLGSAAYQMGPGGRHSAADWQTENRAQMAQERTDRSRRPGRKQFGPVGPDAALPGSDRAARAAVERARRLEATMGASAVATVSSAGVSRPTGRYSRGAHSLLSGIGAKIAQDPTIRAAGRAIAESTAAPATRPTAAIPGYQGHRPAHHTATAVRRTSTGRPF